MLVLISSCAIGVPLIESKVAISDDIELEFKEYRYTNDDRAACEKSESHCFKNGVPVFGTESLHPISHLSALELRYKDTRYQLDTSFMYNAGAEKGHQVNGVVEYFYANCYDAKNCIVRGIFSDAGGTYVAEWKVLDGKPFRTILTTAGDIVSKFVDDIRPPVYQ
ncbi:MAG: hypothetical protein D6160_16580 [Ketobacter sp.]|nr:MAG: hypothetical protein D6160_16580 [Ketobacter sp.]